ncbi:MAG TPA: hypothetical protein VFP58_05425 [Candidatus Eisenbacteria bacterium]|nr:hypothetical protein [Candidatus Eisenbacteria bacterium]
MRKFHRDQQHRRTRLLVLGAALVITVLWAHSETRPRSGSHGGGGGAKASSGIAVAVTTAAAAAAVDEATPEGWGADPFDPRPLGSTPVTTGR